MNLFAPLSPQARQSLDAIPALIDRVFPLPGRFRSSLASDVAELSRLLTSCRGERTLAYLNQPPLLSAYLRFFLPWNLYRLCRLLPGLNLPLAAGDRITDIGCGPLTFAAALWICRPDLRSIPLEWLCIDQSGTALDAGKKFFAALISAMPDRENIPWKIHTVKGDLNKVKAAPASLVCAVNVFNEMYGDISRNNTMRQSAEKSKRLLENFASDSASILVVEPGFPRCGEFISLLRNEFIDQGRQPYQTLKRPPVSPCTHGKPCPLLAGEPDSQYRKKRWCHFAFQTDDAPVELQRLSLAAGIPKERAVLSFLLTGTAAPITPELRVLSDAFPLPPNKYGRYCCSLYGIVLLRGERKVIENIHSGAAVNAKIKPELKDAKSGAFIAELV